MVWTLEPERLCSYHNFTFPVWGSLLSVLYLVFPTRKMRIVIGSASQKYTSWYIFHTEDSAHVMLVASVVSNNEKVPIMVD